MTTQEYEDGLVALVHEIWWQAEGEGGMPPDDWEEQVRAYIRENRPIKTLLSGSYDDLVKAAGTTEDKAPYDEER